MGHPYGPALIHRLTDPAVAAPRRWMRAAVNATAATALALAGHVAAGGSPTVVGAGLALLAVLLPSWLLAGRERGWTVIAGVQVAAQQVIHPLLVTASGVAEPAALPHDLMFFLHVLGALAMAVWLRLGERRSWALARRLAAHLARWSARILHALRSSPATPARPGHPRPVAEPKPGLRTMLRHVLGRRGPPLAA